jgi:phosphate:Na+ symporter
VNTPLEATLSMAMSVVGGLGVFILGMKYMSEGMQAVAGNSLRRMISLVTDHRLLATAVGTGVTMLVQSSSITTVIVVGLVNAGLMQLHQAIGVIMGANIGTTITGWILVLKLGAYGLPILGVAALWYVFARRDRPRFIAMAVMGLGMVFFGLELMKDGFAPMKDVPMFVEAFAWFEADTYWGVLKCAAIGCLLTLLVQSSSATLGITIGLAATGVIPFTTAAALVLGENIGTTITVVLASIGATTVAKRAALAHVLFNTIGVLWITAIFQWYIRVVAGIVQAVHGLDPMTATWSGSSDTVAFGVAVTAGIALTHSGFNILNTIVFLPFLGPYARLLERLVRGPRVKEVRRLRPIDARTVDAPVLGVEQSRAEVVQMGQGVAKMMDWIRELVVSERFDDRLLKKTFHREEVLDNINREIVAYLTDLLDATVPHAIAEEGRRQLRIAHEYESASDRAASVLKAYVKLRERRLELPADQREALVDLHDAVAAFLSLVSTAYADRRTLLEADVQRANQAILAKVRRLRELHLQHMTDAHVDPTLSLVFAGLLTDYRRIRAHTVNLYEASAEPVVAGVRS